MLGVRDCHCHFKTIYWFSYEEEPGIKIKENIQLSNLQRKTFIENQTIFIILR